MPQPGARALPSRPGSSRGSAYADFRGKGADEALPPVEGLEAAGLLVVLADLGVAAREAHELDDPLQELARGAARRAEDDDLVAERERHARAEDGLRAHTRSASRRGLGGATHNRKCLAEAPRRADQHLRVAALPAVLGHDLGLARRPVLAVEHAPAGAHEGLVELELLRRSARGAPLGLSVERACECVFQVKRTAQTRAGRRASAAGPACACSRRPGTRRPAATRRAAAARRR